MNISEKTWRYIIIFIAFDLAVFGPEFVDSQLLSSLFVVVGLIVAAFSAEIAANIRKGVK